MTQVTVIFWNIWLEMQTGGRDDGTKLRHSFEKFIKDYNPDVFGLNEVVADRKTGASPVLDYLKSKGYKIHFTPFSPLSDTWMVGSAIASRRRPTKIREHTLGEDYHAYRKNGYAGYHVKAIEADLKFDGKDIAIVVNYLAALFPFNWTTHVKHRRAYEKLVQDKNHKNIIIGGDFNETKYMLSWLRLPRNLKRRTGSLRSPTWRWNGQRRRLAFANYDHIIWSKHDTLHLKMFKILPRYPSDHAPLLGVFTIEER